MYPPYPHYRCSRSRGFTLIELMIAVAIVGILAMVALPSYQQHVKSSRRAEAQAFMMAVAAKQQQFLLDTRAYATTWSAVAVPVPPNVAAAYDVPATPAFPLTLSPKADQASEKCGTLSISQNLDKTATKGGAAVAGCW